jgi:hypothetical protein
MRDLDPGPDHPDTLVTLGNLVACLRAAENSAEAVPLQLRKVVSHEQHFGPAHPETLQAASLLTNCMIRAGIKAVALPLYLQVLEVTERLLGLYHPASVALRDLRPLPTLGVSARFSRGPAAIVRLHQ